MTEVDIRHEFPSCVHVAVRDPKSERSAVALARNLASKHYGTKVGHYVSSGYSEGAYTYVFSNPSYTEGAGEPVKVSDTQTIGQAGAYLESLGVPAGRASNALNCAVRTGKPQLVAGHDGTAHYVTYTDAGRYEVGDGMAYDDNSASVIDTILYAGALGGSGSTADDARRFLDIARERGRADIPGGVIKYDAEANWGPDGGRNHGPLYSFTGLPSITHAQAVELLIRNTGDGAATQRIQLASMLHDLQGAGVGRAYQEYTAEIPDEHGRTGKYAERRPMRLYFAGHKDGGPVFRATEA